MTCQQGAGASAKFVSIGIIALRRTEALDAVVDHLRRMRAPFDREIIVAVEDPGRGELAERDEEDVRWIDIPGGRGLAYNRNRVVEAARGDVIAFIDDDCMPHPGWLDNLLRPLEDDGVDAVVGRVAVPRSTSLGNAIATLGFPAGGSTGYTKMFPVDEKGFTSNISTANCALRSSVFKDLGGFDEEMTAGGEDSELAHRMVEAGKKTIYQPDAVVTHPARANLRDFSSWFFRRGRATYQFVRKVPGVGRYVRMRARTYARLAWEHKFEPKIVLLLPLLVSSMVLQQAGFIYEHVRSLRGSAQTPDKGSADAAGDSSLARGSLLTMASQIWYLIAIFLLYAYLARDLGPANFGQWRVVFSMLVWLELFVDSGLTKITTKTIAEGRSNPAAVVRRAYVMQGLLTVVVFIGALVLAGPVSWALGDPSLARLLRIASIDIPLYAAFSMSKSIVAGLHRFERQAFGMFSYPLGKLVFMALLVYLGFSVPGALIGNALASVVGFAVTFVPVRRTATAGEAWPPPAPAVLYAAAPFLVFGLMNALPASVDLWLVKGIIRDNAATGLYGAASAFAQTPLFLFLGLHVVLFPSVAKVSAEGDARLAARYARQALRLALLITFLGMGLTMATGREILALVYSQPYVAAFGALVILMMGACARTVWATCAEIMLAVGRKTEVLFLLGAMIVGEIALAVVLIPVFGVDGAAIGGTAAALVVALAGIVRLRVMFDLRLLSTLVRSAAAAAAVGVPLALVRIPTSVLPFAYLAALAVYLIVLTMTGEVEREDLASIRRAFAR